VARYDRWNLGRVLLGEGHRALNFFIILDGEVEIYVKDMEAINAARRGSRRGSSLRRASNAVPLAPGKKSTNGDTPRSSTAGSSLGVPDSQSKPAPDNMSAMLDISRPSDTAGLEKGFIKSLGTLSSGDGFGDFAFASGGVRTASIKTRRTSEFLVISKEEFEYVMSTAMMNLSSLNAQKNLEGFRESCPLFRSVNIDLKALSRYCDVRAFPPNTSVVTEGTDGDYIWFVR
jgi:CRP-like cAMP-binding protein